MPNPFKVGELVNVYGPWAHGNSNFVLGVPVDYNFSMPIKIYITSIEDDIIFGNYVFGGASLSAHYKQCRKLIKYRFKVGERVAFTNSRGNRHRGTIKKRKDFLYEINIDNNIMFPIYEISDNKQTNIKRLVKKKKESKFKIGDRVYIKDSSLSQMRGTISHIVHGMYDVNLDNTCITTMSIRQQMYRIEWDKDDYVSYLKDSIWLGRLRTVYKQKYPIGKKLWVDIDLFSFNHDEFKNLKRYKITIVSFNKYYNTYEFKYDCQFKTSIHWASHKKLQECNPKPVKKKKPNFKVGDRVKFKVLSENGTIKEIKISGDAVIDFDNKILGFSTNVKNPEENLIKLRKIPLKVGDRVRHKDYPGQIFIITKFCDDWGWDSNRDHINMSDEKSLLAFFLDKEESKRQNFTRLKKKFSSFEECAAHVRRKWKMRKNHARNKIQSLD